MKYCEAVDMFKLYISSYCSADTMEYYNINLRLFSNYLLEKYGDLQFDVNELRKEDYIGYIAFHKGRCVKNNTVRTYARAIRAFLRYLWNEGVLLQDITRNVKYPKTDSRIIVPLTSSQVAALDAYISSESCLYQRDLLVLHLMLDCGLRRSEVVNLNMADVRFDDKFILIRNSKYNKSRMLPLPAVVSDYVKLYRSTVPPDADPLVLDRYNMQRISRNAIECLFNRLKAVCPVYPHLLRHTFATSFILGGGSLEVLRVLLGHADYNVTREYLHIAGQYQIAGCDIYQLDDVFFNVYNYRRHGND